MSEPEQEQGQEITPAGFIYAEPASPCDSCHPETIPDEWGEHGPNQAIDEHDRKERCLWRYGTGNHSGRTGRFGRVRMSNRGSGPPK